MSNNIKSELCGTLPAKTVGNFYLYKMDAGGHPGIRNFYIVPADKLSNTVNDSAASHRYTPTH